MMLKRIVCVLCALIMLICLGCKKDSGELSLYLINTGKSDALLINTPSGAFMVDTGLKKSFSVDAVKACLDSAGVSEFDVILTHGHKDHMGGLKKLAKNYKINNVYVNRLDTATYSSEEQHEIISCCSRAITLTAGDTLNLCGVSINVLSPYRAYSDAEGDNDNSLVLAFSWGDTDFLLMGDATKNIEANLLASGANIDADVLKVGRHGLSDASLQEFIDRVSPDYALITNSLAGADAASVDVMDMLEESGAKILANGTEHTAYKLTTDGITVTIGEID